MEVWNWWVLVKGDSSGWTAIARNVPFRDGEFLCEGPDYFLGTGDTEVGAVADVKQKVKDRLGPALMADDRFFRSAADVNTSLKGMRFTDHSQRHN